MAPPSIQDSALPSGRMVCSTCGALVSAASPFIRDGQAYCCEGCFLGRREHRLARIGNDAAAHRLLAEALAVALDAREHETGLHSRRVACHTLVLAGHFTSDETVLQQVYCGALLHDIGKIGIPDNILLKTGPLDVDEWQIMRTHPEVGYRILSSVPFMNTAAEIVLSHEEHYDGSGYPRGLRGEAIPLWARLFAVIDTLDAMTSDRPYRAGLSFDAAKEEIVRMTGKQFDPAAVRAFLEEESTMREMVEAKCRLPGN